MIDIKKDKYIIVELIPTSQSPKTGQLVQLCGIKLHGLELKDRFDYRLNENNINLKEIIEMISYDKESFNYANKEQDIYQEFKQWIEDYPLLILDNKYTKNYLERYNNKKESITDYLDLEYNDNVIEDIIKKYKLEPTNYIVDLLYEGLIYESNNK